MIQKNGLCFEMNKKTFWITGLLGVLVILLAVGVSAFDGTGQCPGIAGGDPPGIAPVDPLCGCYNANYCRDYKQVCSNNPSQDCLFDENCRPKCNSQNCPYPLKCCSDDDTQICNYDSDCGFQSEQCGYQYCAPTLECCSNDNTKSCNYDTDCGDQFAKCEYQCDKNNINPLLGCASGYTCQDDGCVLVSGPIIPEDCTTASDEGGYNSEGQCGDSYCTDRQCDDNNFFKICNPATSSCELLWGHFRSSVATIQGNMKWRLNDEEDTQRSETDSMLVPKIQCGNTNNIKSQKREYVSWVYLKENRKFFFRYRVDDKFLAKLNRLESTNSLGPDIILGSDDQCCNRGRDDWTDKVDVEKGWYKFTIIYEELGGYDCFILEFRNPLDSSQTLNFADYFLAMDSRGPLILEGDIDQFLCEKIYPKGDWEEDSATNPCCGGEESDEGYVFLSTFQEDTISGPETGNTEFICTYFNNEWKWQRAWDFQSTSSLYTRDNPLVSTKSKEGTEDVFFDVVANTEEEIRAGGIEGNAWLGCSATGGVSNFESSLDIFTTNPYDEPYKHIYKQGETLSLNLPVTQLIPGGDEEIRGLLKKDIPLSAVSYTLSTGETTADMPRGQDTGATLPNPKWMCIKKGNVGFWAGCGANTKDGIHDFYPGSRATTVRDFGASETCASGEDYLKPGSRCLYNYVGAFGLEQLPGGTAQVYYKMFLRKAGQDEEYLSSTMTDWREYTHLQFFFHSAKKPEAYHIALSAKNEGGYVVKVYDKKLSDIVSGLESGKWHSISVPLSDIDDVYLKNMNDIKIYSLNDEIPAGKDVSTGISGWDGKTFFDIFFLDAFTLVSTETDKYCVLSADSYDWTEDLDSDYQACNEQPGHIWTGSQCCGDDLYESYNDPANDYACYEGEGIANDELVSFENKNLLNWQGEFYGCSLTTDPSITGWSSDNNINTNCHHFSDANLNSNYYCEVGDKEWKDATVNYDGNSFSDDFIDTEKSTNYFVNLISNGGFETGGNIPNYSESDSYGTYSITREDAHSGTYSLKLIDDMEYQVNIPGSLFVPGKIYNYSLWAKALSGYSGSTQVLHARLYYSDCDNVAWSGGEPTSGAGWEYFSYSFTVDSSCTLDELALYIGYVSGDTEAGTRYVDDIKIISFDSPSTMGCCPATYCWDGSNCIESGSSTDPPIYFSEDLSKGYNCINGGWSVFYKKEKHDDPTDFTYSSVDNKCWDGTNLVDAGIYVSGSGGFLTYYCRDTAGVADWAGASNILNYNDELYSCNLASTDTLFKSNGGIVEDYNNLGSCGMPLNLIKNYGFENGDGTLNWDLTGAEVKQGAIYGNNLVELGNNEYAKQTFNAVVAGVHQFKVWYYGDKDKINVEILQETINNENKEAANGPDGWKLYTGEFSASADTGYTIRISSGGLVYIDNVVVYLVEDYANTFFCDVDDGWPATAIVSSTYNLKDTEKSDSIDTSNGCCASDFCWDGTICKASRELISTEDYLCVDGVWIESVEKWNPSHTSSSSNCIETECFDGTGCVEANTGISGTDDYCEGIEEAGVLINTSWTSRTKVLALQFLDFVSVEQPGKYTLYCDEQSNALNDATGLNGINNLCILNYDGEIALGTTLNIDKSDFISLLSLGTTDCNDITQEDGDFHKCFSDERIWYNPSLDAIIYAKNDIDLDALGNWWTAFTSLLKDLFNIKKTDATENIEFVKRQAFKRLYIYGDDTGKTITGLLGKEDANEFIFVEYSGFSSDLCAIIDQHNDLAGYCATSTDSGGNVYTVYIQDAQPKHKAIWQDLTSKLRIK